MDKDIYKKPWSVYLAQCRDGTLYTGVALDVVARIKEHNTTGKCRYTRYRKPLILLYSEVCVDYHQAREKESQIKRLSKDKKIELMSKERHCARYGPCRAI